MQTATSGNENRDEHLVSSTENEAAGGSGTDKTLGGAGSPPRKEVIELDVKEFVIECTEGECHDP